MDMDPPGLLGLQLGGHHHDMVFAGENEMQVQNVDLDEDASSSAAKHRPPYESSLEESNHTRDSLMFNSSIILRQPSPALHQGIND